MKALQKSVNFIRLHINRCYSDCGDHILCTRYDGMGKQYVVC